MRSTTVRVTKIIKKLSFTFIENWTTIFAVRVFKIVAFLLFAQVYHHIIFFSYTHQTRVFLMFVTRSKKKLMKTFFCSRLTSRHNIPTAQFLISIHIWKDRKLYMVEYWKCLLLSRFKFNSCWASIFDAMSSIACYFMMYLMHIFSSLYHAFMNVQRLKMKLLIKVKGFLMLKSLKTFKIFLEL